MGWFQNGGFGEHWLTCALHLVVAATCMYFFPRILKQVWEYYLISSVDRKGYEDLPLPPGTMGYPLIGETFEFLRKKSDFYREKVEKYGLIYKTHMLGRPTVRVIGAGNVKTILMGENNIVTSNWPTSTQLLLGAGSISQSSGSVHKVRRKYMQHAFSLDTLNDMVPVMQEVIRNSLLDWQSRKEVYTYPECKAMAFAIAACALVGLDVTSSKQSGMHKTFIDFVRNLMTIPFDIPGFGFRKGMNAKRQLLSTLRDLLPETEKRPYTPIMKAYYMSCQKLETTSEEEIYEGIIDLLFAGHETITSTVTNCVMYLGLNKNVVQNVRNELKEHGLMDSNGNDLNYKIVHDLKYLNNVVKEVLRLCPAAGAGFRRALKSFKLGGYQIPKDWTVMYSIRETQHLSPLFDHSDVFDPDRWEQIASHSDTDNTKNFHYIPFGSGARGCVGKMYAQLVTKIFVIELVRTCDWYLKNKKVKLTYIPVPVASDHLPVEFRRKGEYHEAEE